MPHFCHNCQQNLALATFLPSKEYEIINRQAFSIFKESVGLNYPPTGAAAYNLGKALVHQGKTGEAKSFFELSLQIFSATLPVDNPRRKRAQNYLQRIQNQKYMM